MKVSLLLLSNLEATMGPPWFHLEVLRIRLLLDPAPEPEPLTKELELELLGSGSLLESDPPMESALFWVCTSLILIQEAPSVCFHAK